MSSVKLLEKVNSILVHMVSRFHEEYLSEDPEIFIQLALGIKLFNKTEACLPMHRPHTHDHSFFHKGLYCAIREILLVRTFV
jgi:hypothetical protein